MARVVKDIEEFWQDVRVRSVSLAVREEEAEGPEAVFARASKAFMRVAPSMLRKEFTGKDGTDTDVICAMFARMSEVFISALIEQQKKQDISVVIQLFLEASSVPPEDVKDFLRGLPRGVLNRMLIHAEETPNGRRSGLHALFSIEALYRDNDLREDYEIGRESDGTLLITMTPNGQSAPLNFRLRELFTT